MSLYLEHFGLNEPPFRITPHTDFFFGGAERGSTLEALLYAVIHDEGIVKVSGEVGSGKTMLCRVLIERLPEQVDVVYLATASLTREEILAAIADELKMSLREVRNSAALRELQYHLIELYAQGRRVVLLIDEAHAMPAESLEQVRLLSNLESTRHKLLQIVLFGQPELDDALAQPSLRQLRDRITHSFRMRPLSGPEVVKYLDFRLRAAGYRGPELFSPGAAALIGRAAEGLTRRINILSDKALLAAFMESAHSISERHAKAAIADSEFAPPRRKTASRPFLAASAALLAGLVLGAAGQWIAAWEPRQPIAAPVAPLVAPATPVAAVLPVSAPVATAAIAPEADAKLVAPFLNSDQSARFGRYLPAGAKLLKERLSATRGALETEPDQRYSIALFVSSNSDPARMERFLLRARDMVPLDELYVIPLSGTPSQLRVVLGSFPDRAAAAEAARRLPPKYQRAFETELVTFGELRGAL